MKRINLTKYGFIRYPDGDFSDDGSFFRTYRFSDTNSYISKLVSEGQAYLSVHVTGNLPYEVYSTLPNYRAATWSYNGISVESLTDKMLQNFFNACVKYEKEYQAAEASMAWPSIAEIKAQTQKIYALRQQELNKISQLLALHSADLALKLSKYAWSDFQDCLKHLVQEVGKFNPETFPQTIYQKSYSVDFVKPTNSDLKTGYWFGRLMEYIDRSKLN